MLLMKSNLSVVVDEIKFCKKCKPIKLQKSDSKKYATTFKSSCNCLSGNFSWNPFMDMRKIELFYILSKLKRNISFAHYGISKKFTNFGMNHLSFCYVICPDSIHHDFQEEHIFTNVRYEEKQHESYYVCTSNTYQTLHFKKEEIPEVKKFAKLVPNISFFQTIIDAIKNCLNNISNYTYSKMPPFQFLTDASMHERKLKLKLSLFQCLVNTWFIEFKYLRVKKKIDGVDKWVRLKNNYTINLYYYSFQDFINYKENKGSLRRKQYSTILNSYEKIDQFKKFLNIHKEKRHRDYFCIPEDSVTFENFLIIANINSLSTDCRVV